MSNSLGGGDKPDEKKNKPQTNTGKGKKVKGKPTGEPTGEPLQNPMTTLPPQCMSSINTP